MLRIRKFQFQVYKDTIHGTTLLKSHGCKTLCPTDCQRMDWNVRHGGEGPKRDNNTWYSSILDIQCLGKKFSIVE